MPRVVLVDAEPHMLTLLKTRFEQEGFEVVTVRSGEGVTPEVASQRPDLIVLGKGGCEASVPAYLAADVANDVPLILLTASDQVTSPAEEPVRDVAQLKMPFRPSHLVALARKTIAGA